jgi:hypothetical protein
VPIQLQLQLHHFLTQDPASHFRSFPLRRDDSEWSGPSQVWDIRGKASGPSLPWTSGPRSVAKGPLLPCFQGSQPFASARRISVCGTNSAHLHRRDRPVGGNVGQQSSQRRGCTGKFCLHFAARLSDDQEPGNQVYELGFWAAVTTSARLGSSQNSAWPKLSFWKRTSSSCLNFAIQQF